MRCLTAETACGSPKPHHLHRPSDGPWARAGAVQPPRRGPPPRRRSCPTFRASAEPDGSGGPPPRRGYRVRPAIVTVRHPNSRCPRYRPRRLHRASSGPQQRLKPALVVGRDALPGRGRVTQIAATCTCLCVSTPSSRPPRANPVDPAGRGLVVLPAWTSPLLSIDSPEQRCGTHGWEAGRT